MGDRFPKSIRALSDAEARAAGEIHQKAGGNPLFQGDGPPGSGRTFKCPHCGDVLIRDIPEGYWIDAALQCGACAGFSQLVY